MYKIYKILNYVKIMKNTENSYNLFIDKCKYGKYKE